MEGITCQVEWICREGNGRSPLPCERVRDTRRLASGALAVSKCPCTCYLHLLVPALCSGSHDCASDPLASES